ncbi:TolC family protein [Clostridium sp. DJ247]|uniref:TolC family protein n=1 Tax=Clostridium sp. DJ247 TaxID=2726188 RepID=UPI0016271960|nr:TolC family protein [Clostridium sp. DJ247]MBC2581563.1 TolC family protein [Clostridium sp. DJ247]
MKKVRLICIAAIMAAMISSTVSAQAVGNPLDIDNITNMAIENSYQIKSMDISIEKFKNSYKDATRGEGKGNADIEAKYNIYEYTNLKEAAKNGVKLNLYTQYISFMNAEEALDLEQQNFENAEAKYKKAQLQLSLGTISKADSKSIEQAYYDEKAQLNKAERKLDSITKTINQISGSNINTTYNGFTKDLAVDKPIVKTYNDYLNDALKNRAEILNGNEKIKLKKIEFAGVKAAYPYKYMAEYVIGKYSVSEAENQLDTDKIDISIEINGLYNDLQSKIQKLQPQLLNYNSEKKKYDQALQRYNLGMISKIDFQDQVINFKSAENSLKTVERDISLAKLKIEYASGIGTN